MAIFRWFGDLRLRYKLFITYSMVLLLTAGAGILVLDSYVRGFIRQDAESDLTHSANLVINTVKAAVEVSVKNHLRATAENNREIVRYYHQEFVSGRLSEEDAKAAAGAVLLNQPVGKTGYLFVWDVRNAPKSIPLAVHPKIQGRDVADVDFVQKGQELKNGYIEYSWRNPGEEAEREKAMYLAYFEPWQWIIAASSYKEEFLQLVNVGDFRDDILSIRLGRTGYFFIIDSAGTIVVHPALEGNYFDAVDSDGRYFIRDICSMKRGLLSYSWKNPDEASYRRKIASFGYIPEYDWIVAASGYKDEFEAPLQGIRGITLLTAGMAVFLILAISFVVGFFINRPMQKLVDAFEQEGKDLAIRLPVKSLDEIGRLTLHFNRFMDRLERASAERSAAERILRENELFLKETQKIARVGGWMANPHTDYLRWTDGVYEIIGAPRDYLPSLSDGFKIFLPQYIPVLKERLANCLANGETFAVECEVKTMEGKIIWTEVRGLAPVREAEGAYVLGTFQDITERKMIEKETKESLELLHAAIEQSPSGILIADAPNVRIRMANPTAIGIRGKTDRPLVGIELAHHATNWQIFHPDGTPYRSEDLPLSRAILRGEVTRNEESIISSEDGERRWVTANAAPMRNPAGEITSGIVIFNDITEQKRAEEDKTHLQAQLAQAQKMESVGRLAGGVAHDFNNKIQAILGYASLSLSEVSPESPIYGWMVEVKKAAQQSADLTRQLLGFARKQTVSLQVIDLNETISGLLKMLQRIVGEDIKINWAGDPVLWNLKMDPTQIDQILVNLIVNSRDAITGPGIIEIRTENFVMDSAFCDAHPGAVPRDYVLLSVSDSGCGMNEQILHNIFEPFYTTKELGKGTGLGLATVYGIVKQNEGYIDVQSEPGKGTDFRIFLPRVDGKVAVAGTEHANGTIPRGTETVLIVEDEANILFLGREILQRQGYTVLTANTPKEALRVAEDFADPIHLLITDVVMPEMNGRDLRDRFNAVKPCSKCIFMSGYPADVIAHHGVLNEGIDFLKKPFSLKRLAEKVREVLDSQK